MATVSINVSFELNAHLHYSRDIKLGKPLAHFMKATYGIMSTKTPKAVDSQFWLFRLAKNA